MTTADDVRLRPVDHPLDHTIRLPGSKSLSNRALLIAALAGGTSEISNLLLADDTRHMVTALRTLGVPIRIDEDTCRATVSGREGHWPGGEAEIFCGNAGTVIRFLTAACCLGHGAYRLDGVPRIRQRPIGDLVDTLRDIGASIGYEEQEGFCPLTIQASGLSGGRTAFKAAVSSQFVSALLIAAPLAADDVLIEIAGPLPSKPYVGMTLKVMEAFGVSVVAEEFRRFIVPARQPYSATHYAIEPDASAASYFFAAAALAGGRITVEGLGRESCQGDIHFVEVLERMGCGVELESRRTTVRGPATGRLRGVDVDLGDMPDVAQTLA
ncbi:MAG: 3-phosphoshikimate 1-carboxyvinyltransferase, partial [Phycisphaerae bacterium]